MVREFSFENDKGESIKFVHDSSEGGVVTVFVNNEEGMAYVDVPLNMVKYLMDQFKEIAGGPQAWMHFH